ncbi:Surface lipoprotein [uncultured Candidatus Thioglobus sp.]|nr:Surface lipoprotein [uncultured Candidatus Thioglobus sp.]
MKKILFLSFLLSTMVIADDNDPFEDVNRLIDGFNQTLDGVVFEPIAKSYKKNVAQSVQNRVSDFSSNISDANTLGNELVQFELGNGSKTLGRVLINSTVGLLGLFDVASDIGLEKTNEDFGQTLAVWGVSEGPYVVLPFFGPSTVRDTVGLAVDSAQKTKRTKNIKTAQKVGITVSQTIDTRVKLLPATDLLKRADDPYISLRSAYLQKRQFDVYNGKPPEEDEF